MCGKLELRDKGMLGVRLSENFAECVGGRSLDALSCRAFDVEIECPSDMEFEPDLLEAARVLHLSLPFEMRQHQRVDLKEDASSPKHLEISIAIRDDLIWRHYEMINSRFFVFNEHEAEPLHLV